MATGIDNICVVIGRTRHKMIQVEIVEAAKRGARLVELRLDFLAKAPDFKRLLAEKPCALVATVRRQQDGGRWTGTEAERRILLRQAIVAGFDWVDLETDAADEIRRFKDVKRIISYHNLREIPADLEKIYDTMCGQDPDVVKIAVAAQRSTDNLRVLELVKNAKKPTVAFCLGDIGFPSRILAGKYGAPFAYAAFNRERTIALGIPSFDEMRQVYRYQRIGQGTEIYGVIGDPIGHSLSPTIHNAAFHGAGIDAVYLPFRVPRGELKAFLEQFNRIPVRGYSVTIPHKEVALALSRHKDEIAARIGAANTLVRDDEGFSAFNTDYPAARDSLLANIAPKSASAGLSPWDGKSVLILGAGGGARAVAHMLQRDGALVTITGRTEERATDLADDIGCKHTSWDSRHKAKCELLINCTPVGMSPNIDESPIHHSFLKPEMRVFDTIYTPEATVLVKEARARGCTVLTGVDMFVRQAEMQFRHFTGREPPPDLMRTVVKRALSPVVLSDDEA